MDLIREIAFNAETAELQREVDEQKKLEEAKRLAEGLLLLLFLFCPSRLNFVFNDRRSN